MLASQAGGDVSVVGGRKGSCYLVWADLVSSKEDGILKLLTWILEAQYRFLGDVHVSRVPSPGPSELQTPCHSCQRG